MRRVSFGRASQCSRRHSKRPHEPVRLLQIGVVVLASSEDTFARFWTFLKWAVAVLWTWAGHAAFGANPEALIGIYIRFVLLDFASGILASFLMRRVDSSIALRGILKKCMGLVVISFGHAIDLLLAIDHPPAGTAILVLLTKLMIGYECVSIAENAACASILLPKSVADIYTRLIAPNVPKTEVVVDTVEKTVTTTAKVQSSTPPHRVLEEVAVESPPEGGGKDSDGETQQGPGHRGP